MTQQLIHGQMSKIMMDIDAIAKSSKNESQGYKFRGIDAIYNELHGIMAKHEVFMLPEVLTSQREERTGKSGGVLIYTSLRVKYHFVAKDGSSVTATTEGEAMDSGDKSSNKAMSAAQKYCLLQTFLIPTVEDKDTESSSPEPLSKHERPQPAPAGPMIAPTPVRTGLGIDPAPILCTGCGAPLRLTKAGTHYGCPNYQDKSIRHSYLSADEAAHLRASPGPAWPGQG